MIRRECLDWEKPPSFEEEEDKYDLIFGADIVYEQGHAELIRGVVERALKMPSGPSRKAEDVANTGGIFWLMYPLRHTHVAESESIERVFGLTKGGISDDNQLENGWRLGILEVEGLSRKKGIGRGEDEVSYKLLKIGWVGI
jgi:hypothetical protein